MSIQNAIILLKAIDTEPDVRAYLYSCEDVREIAFFLEEMDCAFSIEEFEDAVNYLHLRCTDYDDAQELLQKADWFRYLMVTNNKRAV
jgi:hypothetical protein